MNSLSAVSYQYLKVQRLLSPAQFRVVFDAPEKKIHQSHLMAFIKKNEVGHARLGMAITKKKVPTAVKRNVIKRQAREGFRLQSHELLDVDIVIIIKKPLNGLSKKELKNQIFNIFKKIKNEEK